MTDAWRAVCPLGSDLSQENSLEMKDCWEQKEQHRADTFHTYGIGFI